MINLNTTDHSSEMNPLLEFYKDDMPLRFLPGIKDVNVIVGANNSRKSRFFRSILSLEQKKLVHVEANLNVFYYNGVSIAEKVSKLSENGIGGALVSMRNFAPDDSLDEILVAFFDEIKNPYRVLDSENISKLIQTVNELILQLADDGVLERLNRKIEQLGTACGLILYLYMHLKSKGDKLVSELSYPNGPYKHMQPTVPGVKSQEIVPFVQETITVIQEVEKWINQLKGIQFEVHKKNSIYIPVLRTSRNLSGTLGDVYSETIKVQHFNGKIPAKVEIETGLNLYEKFNFAKNGTSLERKGFTEFEQFLGLTFFKSNDLHIVPYANKANTDRTILITVPGQMEDVPIYDLGDGVQSIINLLFPIFTANKGDWIFIDEPENHLHPGFQNIFMSAIGSNKFLKEKQLRFFLNTHSNHILSEAFLSASETSIFVFSNRDSNSSNISVFNQSDYSTLELLGVMNTSVFITNCTVWVEGITDRFYIRAFLHAYCLTLEETQYRPNEGFDFSFVEYAGKNLVHYDFDNTEGENIASYFLNSNVFLLADSDFDEQKHIKYDQIDKSNFCYQKTEVPEIENLIPEAILKRFLLEEIGADIDSIKKLPTIRENVKLGKALKGITKNGVNISIEAKYGGTLSPYYKSKLSKYVYEQILSGEITWDNLSVSSRLRDIVIVLYKFVQARNKK